MSGLVSWNFKFTNKKGIFFNAYTSIIWIYDDAKFYVTLPKFDVRLTWSFEHCWHPHYFISCFPTFPFPGLKLSETISFRWWSVRMEETMRGRDQFLLIWFCLLQWQILHTPLINIIGYVFMCLVQSSLLSLSLYISLFFSFFASICFAMCLFVYMVIGNGNSVLQTQYLQRLKSHNLVLLSSTYVVKIIILVQLESQRLRLKWFKIIKKDTNCYIV